MSGEPRYRQHDYVDLLMTLMEAAVRNWVGGDGQPLQPVTASAALDPAEIERLAGGDERFLVAEMVNIDRAITYCLREEWVPRRSQPRRQSILLPRRLLLPRPGRAGRELVRAAAFADGNELVAWRSSLDLINQRVTRGVTEDVLVGYSRCADAFEAMGAQAELAGALGALTYYTMVHTGQPQVALAERAVVARRASEASRETWS